MERKNVAGWRWRLVAAGRETTEEEKLNEMKEKRDEKRNDATELMCHRLQFMTGLPASVHSTRLVADAQIRSTSYSLSCACAKQRKRSFQMQYYTHASCRQDLKCQQQLCNLLHWKQYPTYIVFLYWCAVQSVKSNDGFLFQMVQFKWGWSECWLSQKL